MPAKSYSYSSDEAQQQSAYPRLFGFFVEPTLGHWAYTKHVDDASMHTQTHKTRTRSAQTIFHVIAPAGAATKSLSHVFGAWQATRHNERNQLPSPGARTLQDPHAAKARHGVSDCQ